MAKKSELLQEKIDRIMMAIPPMPKSLDHSWIIKNVFKDSKYIFYKRRGKVVDGVCSVCKSKVVLDDARHNKTGKCPNCKSKIIFKAVNKAKTFEDKDVISVMQRMSNGSYVVRYIKVILTFKEREDTTNFPDIELGKLIDPKLYVWEGSREILTINKYNKTSTKYYEELYDWKIKDWVWKKERKRCAFFNKELLRDTIPYVFKRNLKQLTKNTHWKYSGIDYLKATHFNIGDYLYAYERYPAIEMLSKLNLTELLKDVIHRTLYWGGIGGSIKMDSKMLGLTKQVFNTTKRLNLNIRGIEFVSTLEELNRRLTDEQIIWVLNNSSTETFTQLLRFVSATKVINYTEKYSKYFIEKNNKHYNTDKSYFITTYRDYLTQCEKLELDLKDDIILFPKDLNTKHEEYTQLIKQKVNEKYDIGIKEQYDKWQELLGYNQGPLRIEVASGHKILLEEGKILKHCVGSYSSRMANGETLILFIRKNGKPYYTVEFKPDTLKTLQIRGLQNKAASNDIKKFVNKWKIKKVMNIKQSMQEASA